MTTTTTSKDHWLKLQQAIKQLNPLEKWAPTKLTAKTSFYKMPDGSSPIYTSTDISGTLFGTPVDINMHQADILVYCDDSYTFSNGSVDRMVAHLRCEANSLMSKLYSAACYNLLYCDQGPISTDLPFFLVTREEPRVFIDPSSEAMKRRIRISVALTILAGQRVHDFSGLCKGCHNLLFCFTKRHAPEKCPIVDAITNDTPGFRGRGD